jgi:heme exporter protein C
MRLKETQKKYKMFLIPLGFICATALLTLGTWWGIYGAGPDYQQKQMIRMLYIHVPSAWTALGCYGMLALSSLIFLVTRGRIWDLMAGIWAEIGCVFTALCLVTGSLWGKPMWGTYWVWDARLTSMAFLQFIYVGYLMFRHQQSILTESRARMAGILALVGALNLPIVKWSVTYWTTLHQGSTVFRWDGTRLDSAFWPPLALITTGIGVYVLAVFALRLGTKRADLKRRKNHDI